MYKEEAVLNNYGMDTVIFFRTSTAYIFSDYKGMVGIREPVSTELSLEVIMNKDDFSYCGLNCITCKTRFAAVRAGMAELDSAFEEVNMQEMVKAIPLMNGRYKGYKKLAAFFNNECPGCRSNGGNPFCGIRRCAKKKGYHTCVEWANDLCGKFKTLLKVHRDNEIQNNRELIKSIR